MKDNSRSKALAALLVPLQDMNASQMMIENIKQEILNLKHNNDTITTETETDNS